MFRSGTLRPARPLPPWGALGGFLLLELILLTLLSWVEVPGVPHGFAPLLLASVLAGMILLGIEGREMAELGFPLRPGPALRGFWGGVGLGAGLVLALGGLLLAGGVLRMAWGGPEGGGPSLLAARGLAAGWYFLIPAAAEEVLFRGYPFRVLDRWLGPWPALGLTAGAFAWAHGANPGFSRLAAVNLFLSGVLLGAVVLRTGTLWLATGAHVGWNWAQVILLDLPVSGLERLGNPAWSSALSGPAWVSGGSFGIEGSVWTTGLLLAVLIWIALRPGGVGGPVRRRAPGVAGVGGGMDEEDPFENEHAPGGPLARGGRLSFWRGRS